MEETKVNAIMEQLDDSNGNGCYTNSNHLTLGGKLIKPNFLKNADFFWFLLEPFDVVYT